MNAVQHDALLPHKTVGAYKNIVTAHAGSDAHAGNGRKFVYRV